MGLGLRIVESGPGEQHAEEMDSGDPRYAENIGDVAGEMGTKPCFRRSVASDGSEAECVSEAGRVVALLSAVPQLIEPMLLAEAQREPPPDWLAIATCGTQCVGG